MLKMFKTKILKKIIAIIAIVLISFSSMISSSLIVNAADFEFWDLFDQDQKGLSFTNYEGRLTELNKAGYDSALTSSSDLKEFVLRIVDFALGFLGLIAVLVVIYGGVNYVTSAGDGDKASKGKQAITYAAIGLVIVMGSFAFVNTVIRGAGGGADSTGSTIIAANTGGGFNASAEQVRSLAVDVYTNFQTLNDITTELKNIRGDASKSSLDPLRLPQKTDVVNFLRNSSQRLGGLKLKIQKFSETETSINQAIRKTEYYHDLISSLSQESFAKINGSNIEYCNPQESTAGTVLFGEQACQGFVRYNNGIFENWTIFREGILSTAAINAPVATDITNADVYNVFQLGEVLDPARRSYENKMIEIICTLEDSYESVRNLQAVNQGEAGINYNKMMQYYKGSADPSGGDSILSCREKLAANQSLSGLIGDIRRWDNEGAIQEPSAVISSANQNLLLALEAHSKYYQALSSLQYVQARLTATTLEGSAPLAITFDALATFDPAGGSLDSTKITWDLAGTKTLSELEREAPGFLANDAVLQCELLNSAVEKAEFIGATSQRCTFSKPGTYRAAIKISSNDPTKYAPGISFLTIRVRPPSSKINLKMFIPPDRTEEIISYVGDEIVNEKNSISLTLKEAERLDFDASGTAQVETFAWDFDNGDVRAPKANPKAENVKYTQVGNYQVTLTVTNVAGVVDRKIFTIRVSNLAARIAEPNSANYFIKTPIVFDGSGSRSDLGTIKSYDWVIEPVSSPAGIEIKPVTKSGPNLMLLNHQFDYPLEYRVRLKVTDNNNQSAETEILVAVKSQSPKAQFSYKIPEENQPGTVHFDGGLSFDPDGTSDQLRYSWVIDGDANSYRFVEGSNANSREPKVKFLKTGEYNVTLKVENLLASNEESSEVKKTVIIDKVLDLAWDNSQQVTASIDEDGKAPFSFKFLSEKAVAYEIDFGDGENSNGNFRSTQTVEHEYSKSGRFTVRVTAYDADDNDTTISRKIFVGSGESPIAKAGIKVNNVSIIDLDDPIEVTKSDQVIFDASESVNTDGTGRQLVYSWDFGDTVKSSNREAIHRYKEISPQDPGYYTVKLVVWDKDEPSLISEDEIRVKVVSAPPRFSSIQGIPTVSRGELVTPVGVTMKVFGAEDPDGQIIQYKWWYFDLTNPTEQLGVQITTAPGAQLIIGTKGRENEEKTYGLGLEVTDSDNLTFSSTDLFDADNVPTIKVKNGPNALPEARFNVSTTKVFAGEKIVFTSASRDPDGRITTYIWDFEGDGFFNNAPTDKSSIEQTYTDKNLNGYDVRLKVVDDKGGEAISTPVKIYVDALTNPPVAAFKYEIVNGSQGLKVQFTNNSTSDTAAGARINKFTWDFDVNSNQLSADSDGDGVKSNDADSAEENPAHVYSQYGIYQIKLTVNDNQGNKDEVINTLELKDPSPTTTTPISPVFTTQPGTSGSTGTTGTATGTTTVTTTGPTTGTPTSPTTTTPTTSPFTPIKAVLSTTPVAASDNIVYLTGDTGSVILDFSNSQGPISYYIIDKNINIDTDGNGVKNDDQNFRHLLPGRFNTNFSKSDQPIVVKLTVVDIYGNQDSLLQEVRFK